MIPSNTIKLNRRSFIVGGALTLVGACAGMSGCNHKVNNSSSNGKVISAALSCSSTNYSPVGSNSALMISAGWHVFESLYDYDSTTWEIKAVLADGDPEWHDKLSCTVKIRDGAKFSDGTEVTSYDVVNAFETNRNTESYKSYLSFIKSVQPDGKQKVKFVFNYDIGYLFMARSCMVRIYPTAQLVEDLAVKPIGSGPWAYSSIDGKDGGIISFVPNKYYNGRYPAGDISMHWTINTDDQSRIAKLNSGSADIIDDIAVSSTKYEINEEMVKIHGLGNACTYLMFNTLKEPFGDKRVRQAIHYAINTEGIIKDLKGGYGSPASCILSTGHAAYLRASNVYDYNPDKARQLLSEADASNLSFTILVDDDYTSGSAEYIKNNLEDVGITCTTKVTEINWNLLNESASTLPFDVIMASGDPSSIGTDSDLLMSWQYEDNVWMNGRSCFKKSNPDAWKEINALMQAARETPNQDKREILQKCYNKISEEIPVYPLFHREMASAYNPKKINNYNDPKCAGVNCISATLFS